MTNLPPHSFFEEQIRQINPLSSWRPGLLRFARNDKIAEMSGGSDA
jgi:hypothetical protein